MRLLTLGVVVALLSPIQVVAQRSAPIVARLTTTLPQMDLAGLELDVGVTRSVSVVAVGQFRRERVQCLGMGQIQELPPFYHPCGVEGRSLGAGARIDGGRSGGAGLFLQADAGAHWFDVGGYREPFIGLQLGVGGPLTDRGRLEASLRWYRVSGYARVDDYLIGEGTAVRSFGARHVFDLGVAMGLSSRR